MNSDERMPANQGGLRDKIDSPLEQATLLARTLELTQEMLLRAQQGDWQKVADLEIARRRELELCFSIAIIEAKGELVAEALAVLLHLNEELLNLLMSARDHAKRATELQSVGQVAAETYHNTRELA